MRMATGKRYYWMKLKESFMTSDTIDFFMSQPNGAQYVVLYQMLCLKTINTNGKLERRIGEVLIPFDVAKITRDMKWFSEDTVRVAMQLYQQFGLIYKDEDGVLVMADHKNLVGSETDYAVQKNNQRNLKRAEQKKLPIINVDSCVDSGVDNVHTDIEIRDRDKEIEIRDIEKEEKKGDEPSPPPPDHGGKNIDHDSINSTLDADFHRIQQDHNDVLNAAQDAGFPNNNATFDKLIALYADYGKEIVLAGISACVDQGKTVISYLKACCKHIAEEKKKPDAGMDEGFWGWDQ